jgi:glycosyltransferase involved in cell wall biosynthesis
MNLSIVIPLLNEEDSLEELFQELIKFVKPTIYLMKSGL